MEQFAAITAHSAENAQDAAAQSGAEPCPRGAQR